MTASNDSESVELGCRAELRSIAKQPRYDMLPAIPSHPVDGYQHNGTSSVTPCFGRRSDGALVL